MSHHIGTLAGYRMEYEVLVPVYIHRYSRWSNTMAVNVKSEAQ